MSSINTTMKLSNSGMNTEFIKYIKYAGALVSPKEITKYIQPVPSEECYFRNVFWMDLDLMITRMKIDLREDLSTGKLIKKNIDAAQRIFVLDGDSIQRPVINI
jgi:hypothetical protein